MARAAKKRHNSNGANLWFEATRFRAADKLRGSMEASECRHVVLGLTILKSISDAFESKRNGRVREGADTDSAFGGIEPSDRLLIAGDGDQYVADCVFRLPKEGRRSHLQANAKQPSIENALDDVMLATEEDRFVDEYRGRMGDIAISGQESGDTTWRLPKMNPTVRAIDANIRWSNEGSFDKDAPKARHAGYIPANLLNNRPDRERERPCGVKESWTQRSTTVTAI